MSMEWFSRNPSSLFGASHCARVVVFDYAGPSSESRYRPYSVTGN